MISRVAVSEAVIGGLLGAGIAGALITAAHQRGEAFRQRRLTAADQFLAEVDAAHALLGELVDLAQAANAPSEEELEQQMSSSSTLYPTEEDKESYRFVYRSVRQRAEFVSEGKQMEDRWRELETSARARLRTARSKEKHLSLLFPGGTRVLPAATLLVYSLDRSYTALQPGLREADQHRAFAEVFRVRARRDDFAAYARRVINSNSWWAAFINSLQASRLVQWWSERRMNRAVRGTFLNNR
jgi:hypothetical protein